MSSNDVLKSIPAYLKDIEDIKSFSYALYKELLNKKTQKNRILADINFSSTMTEGAERWKKILGGYEGGSRTSEKDEIIRKLNCEKLVTTDSLENYLEWRCGEGCYSIEFDEEELVLSVQAKVNATERKVTYDRIRELIPCNIFLEFEIMK
jgi:hypothetical protein